MDYRYYIVSLFLLTSCSFNNGEKTLNNLEVIKINEDNVKSSIKLSQYLNTLVYLTLKTPDTFIPSIKDMKVYDNKIFVHDKQNARILIFEAKSGELISKIQSQGQGPEEYSDITFFDVNDKNKTVSLFDITGGTIFNFKYDGSFESKLMARVICRDFSIANDGGYYFYSPDEINTFNNKEIGPGLLYMERDGTGLSNIIAVGDAQFYPILGSGKSLLRSSNQTYLFSNYSDTLYTVSNNQIIRKTFLEYNTPMDQSLLSNSNIDLSNMGFPMLKLKPFVSEDYIGYTFIDDGKPKSVIHSREKNETTVYSQVTNDLNTVPYVFNGYLVNDGKHYVCIIDEALIETFIYLLGLDEISDSQKSKMKEFIADFERRQSPILAIGKTN